MANDARDYVGAPDLVRLFLERVDAGTGALATLADVRAEVQTILGEIQTSAVIPQGVKDACLTDEALPLRQAIIDFADTL